MDNTIDDATLLALCASIAYEAHQGQYRRDGITPYIEHPKAVAARLKGTWEKCVGLLHDVVEDTDVTFDDLKGMGVPESIVDGVIYITKREGESLQEYYVGVKRNPLSLAVKIEDMIHNLTDNPAEKQVLKYARGLLFLLEED